MGPRIAEGVVGPVLPKSGGPLDKAGAIRKEFSGEGTTGGTAGKLLVFEEKKYSVKLKPLTVIVLKKTDE